VKNLAESHKGLDVALKTNSAFNAQVTEALGAHANCPKVKEDLLTKLSIPMKEEKHLIDKNLCM